jgi:hypothetical protein
MARICAWMASAGRSPLTRVNTGPLSLRVGRAAGFVAFFLVGIARIVTIIRS